MIPRSLLRLFLQSYTPYKCFSFRNYQGEYQSQLLSRVIEVSNENESRKIVDQLIKRGEPIGIDMEGIMKSKLSLLSLRDSDKNIYLFRTFINEALLTTGGLKDLLENPDILKIMHASINDVMMAYRLGIHVWSLYDTAIAHKVYLYQTHGVPISGKISISFNKLCQFHGFHENPVKYDKEGQSFQNKNPFHSQEPLGPDLVFYCASDVEPLIDLFFVSESLIDSDFKILSKLWTESLLYRCVDPNLIQHFRDERAASDSHDLFLQLLPSHINSSYLYELLTQIPSLKKVLLSPTYGTAHILTNSRSSILQVDSLLKECQKNPNSLFYGVESRLLLPCQEIPNTRKEKEEENQKCSTVNKGQEEMPHYKENICSFVSSGSRESRSSISSDVVPISISSSESLSSLIELIQWVKCPVVCSVSSGEPFSVLELFLLRPPVFKIELSPSLLESEPFFHLMTSDSILKLVFSLNQSFESKYLSSTSPSSSSPSSISTSTNKSFTEMQTAIQIFEYFYCGTDFFREGFSYKEALSLFYDSGFTRSQRPLKLLYIYFHLHTMLPDSCWTLIETLRGSFKWSKRTREDFKRERIQNTLHIHSDVCLTSSNTFSSLVSDSTLSSIVGKHHALLSFSSENEMTSGLRALERISTLKVSRISSNRNPLIPFPVLYEENYAHIMQGYEKQYNSLEVKASSETLQFS